MEVPQPMLSQRGRPLLVFNQQKFAKQRIMSTGEVKWRCVVKSCNSFIKTKTETDITLTGSRLEHRHDEISDRILQRQYLSSIAKMKGIDSIERPSKLVGSILSNAPSTSLQPNDLLCIKRNLYNARRKSNLTLPSELQFYKECLVKGCKNKSSTHPIEFFLLPESAYSYCKDILHINQPAWENNKFCCQEHFDIRYDCINFENNVAEPLELHQSAFPRFNLISKTVKFCLVPRCFSSKYFNPEKFFFKVPADRQKESLWLETIGDAKVDNIRYFCQDHFNLNHDIIDNDKYISLKPDVIPHLRLEIGSEMEETDENGFDQFEKSISMDELKNQNVWVHDGSYNPQSSTREAFILSLLPDLKEMSDIQINEFKDGVSKIIKDILNK